MSMLTNLRAPPPPPFSSDSWNRGCRIKEGRAAPGPGTKEGLREYVSPLGETLIWKSGNCQDLMNDEVLPGST